MGKAAGRWLLPLLLIASLSQCDACGAPTLAELTTHSGPVQKQLAQPDNDWSPADKGTPFVVGDALRTGEDSTAGLRFFPDGRLRVEPATVIRFLDSPPEAPRRLQVENGQIEIEAVSEIDIATEGGLARVSKGSRVSVLARDRRTQILVEVGSVAALDEGQQATAGQRLILEVGSVIAEEVPTTEPAATQLAEGDSEDEVEDGEKDEDEAALDRASDEDGPRFAPEGARPDFVVDRSRVVTVHDPRTPTRVGLSIPECASGIEVEVRHGRSGWSKALRARVAVAELPKGVYHYRGRCEGSNGGYAMHGRLAVHQDAATRRLPTKTPMATVDMDGRKYTVQYQNLLPSLRFVWSKAPQSESYVLEQKSENGVITRTPAGSNGVAVVRSGKLEEGTYSFRMRTAGGRSSLSSTVRIAFDNNALSAYLSSPQDGGFAREQPARVVGAALAGAAVSTEEGSLRVTKSGRFEGTSKMLATEDALVVQVQHPKSGTHYYLRYPR